MFRVLTLAREYGSGGGKIGQAIAAHLGWTLIDKEFVERVAQAAKVDPRLAQGLDERTDSWLERLSHHGLWQGAFDRVSYSQPSDFFDAETMAALARRMIEDAYRQGNAVIVGRGGQCVLQARHDAFHVFVYAPWAEKVARVRARRPAHADIDAWIHARDRQRADYMRSYYECDWMNPHLYHLMISSTLGEALVESTILQALQADNLARR